MAVDAHDQPWTCSDEEWRDTHAPLNSAGCHRLALSELRRMHQAGEPIVSSEYGPREVAAERALFGDAR